MSVKEEITALEERLRVAELGPDAAFFEKALADDAILVAQDGKPFAAKQKVVAAHRPGGGPGFSHVQMTDMAVIEHGATAAVVTCRGTYTSAQGSVVLRFMRVWIKRDGRWQIIAGTVSPAT